MKRLHAVLLLMMSCSIVCGEPVTGAPHVALTTDQIVARMELQNEVRAEELKHYHAVRHYALVYRGYSRILTAQMDVDATYDANSGKTFHILRQSGSKLLCDKVLKRAVESESEASRNMQAIALSAANYRFHQAADETLNGRPSYVFDVEPISANKFLYRGRVWVDAQDFAVAKIEGEPARNPSFLISRVSIQHTSAQAGGFWLPGHNRSETSVRLGGTAVLTIDYGSYQTVPESIEPLAEH